MVRACLGALAVLLVLAVPVAGQANASAVSVEGDLLAASSPSALLFARTQHGHLSLDAAQATLHLVDDWVDVYRAPSGYDAVAIEQRHDRQEVPAVDLRLVGHGLADPGGLALVPAGSDHRVASMVHGRIDVGEATDEVLERNHYETEDFIGVRAQYAYEYRSGDGLQAIINGSTHHTVEGDFTLYVWGIRLDIGHRDGEQTYRTGYYETTSPVDAHAGILVRQHYAHAVIHVRDGRLDISGRTGGIYGTDIDLDAADGVMYASNAAGTLTERDGTRHTLRGGVVAQGGEYTFSRGDSGIDVAVLSGPAGVHGATTISTPPSALPWDRIWIAAGIALLGLGIIYVRPVAIATTGQWRRRRLFGWQPRMGWRELRAEGHRMLAIRAETRRHPRRALWHVERSLTIEPDNPEVLTLRGILLRRSNRCHEAVEAHKMAHTWLDALDEQRHDVAQNAYEAARACALTERHDEALHWLGIAVRSDEDLCGDVASEPDFASIRETTEYRSIMRGWKPTPAGNSDWDDLLSP